MPFDQIAQSHIDVVISSKRGRKIILSHVYSPYIHLIATCESPMTWTLQVSLRHARLRVSFKALDSAKLLDPLHILALNFVQWWFNEEIVLLAPHNNGVSYATPWNYNQAPNLFIASSMGFFRIFTGLYWIKLLRMLVDCKAHCNGYIYRPSIKFGFWNKPYSPSYNERMCTIHFVFPFRILRHSNSVPTLKKLFEPVKHLISSKLV